VESSFADHRTYYYRGEPVDEQIHFGFDLASLARSPVEASNGGNVVYAEYLGIYGNCVILDHGLGLFSLYGHLSSIDVEKGQAVARGQSLGRTGQTGLAGGDHLHYSMIVQGVQVTPLEWWDPNWVRLHVIEKLRKPSDTDH
jgi:murein DD-endopeptidase MepM/ murein hydrolase activator NlpD